MDLLVLGNSVVRREEGADAEASGSAAFNRA
jgi:hypothetical protein